MASSASFSCGAGFHYYYYYAAVVLHIILLTGAEGQLSSTFYENTCPDMLPTVKSMVKAAVAKEPRIGASILRLHFHDCFVNGCDGSILLDDTATFTGEKTAGPNNNSVRGFEVIDNIKTGVESVCKGVVSCADILATTARDSVVELGGPSWTVLLGRRDSRTASRSQANSDIPAPTSNLSNLISKFQAQGLSVKDLVALSGGHTIGQARCTIFRARIYNDTNIDPAYSKNLQAKCPQSGGDNNLSPLDLATPTFFDNNYYRNLQLKRGLLHSDQELFNGGSTDSRVNAYACDPDAFAADFAVSMVKMGNIKPMVGTNGEIRSNCRKRN